MESAGTASQQQPLRVIIVDDNADDRALASRALRARYADLEAREVADAQGLAQVLAEDTFDALITDYQLLWGTGLEVLRQVKARYPEAVVIMFTATGTQEVAVEAMREGLSDYVIKSPQHFIRLTAALQRALDHAQAQREARLALEAREHFLMIAAHELRTPLTTISGTIEGVQHRLQRVRASLPPETQSDLATVLDALGRARRQVARLNRLQEDIATAVRLDTAAALPVEVRPIDLAATARSMIEAQHGLSPERAIILEGPERLIVRADGERLEQVIANLLGNAIKFSAEDQPIAVSISRESAPGDRGEVGRVAITDHGPGVPAEEQVRIWDYLYRRRELSYVSGSSVGLGLGLYIVRALVAQMEGQTGVESTPGQGSTFWLTLPAAQDGSEGTF